MNDERFAKVDIVLAAFNGEEFLERQLGSIACQTHENWRLFIRDDGSKDGTLRIARDFALRHPGQVTVIEDGTPTGSAKGNFSRLLAHTTAGYVAFCDQDDIWLPDRLASTLKALIEVEHESGKDMPVLVHSDLAVIDETGVQVAPSLWSFQNLDGEWPLHFGHALTQNVVTGCATTVNRALVDLAMPIPDEAVMHDWWLAVVASAFGRVRVVQEVTVQYRQHGHNQVGAKRFNIAYVGRLARRLLRPGGREEVLHLCQQAEAFVERFPGAGAATVTARALAELPNQHSWLQRKRVLIAHGFWKIGLTRNLAWFLFA